ncbi:MAG: hypothetical protein EXR95_08410 [Gemmatimonadetes bacterium]|nr:hypothetical protein [Gemmatimonadota bacterium]
MDRNLWQRVGKPLAVTMALALAACGGKDADDTLAADSVAALAAPSMPAATEVQAIQLQNGAAALAGQTVRVNSLKVVSRLGPRGFWVELPNKNPFLVVTTDSAAVSPQTMVDVVGTVTVMNDSILGAWVTSGAITENQKLEAEFATEFLQAQAVSPMGSAPAETTAAPR